MSPCPHCGASARVEASAFFRWRCGVCGGPVAPEGTRELSSLVRAHRARAMAVGWFTAAFVFASIAACAGALAMLLWSASHAAALVLGGVTLVAALVAVTGRARGMRRNADAREALGAAWGGPPASPRVAPPLLAGEEKGP